MVDLPSFLFASKWVNKHQKPVWTPWTWTSGSGKWQSLQLAQHLKTIVHVQHAELHQLTVGFH